MQNVRTCPDCGEDVSLTRSASNAVYCLLCVNRRRLERGRVYNRKPKVRARQATREKTRPKRDRKQYQQVWRQDNPDKCAARIERRRKGYPEANRRAREAYWAKKQLLEDLRKRPQVLDDWRPFNVPDYLKSK